MISNLTELGDHDSKSEAIETSEMVAQLAKLFGLPPAALLPVCMHLAGVSLGNAAKVVTPIFPSALNLALGCIVCEDGQGPLSMAIDFLSQPIRATQDVDVMGLSERAWKTLEEEAVRLEVADGKSFLEKGTGLNDGVTQIEKLRRSIRPFVWIEDPRPGQLLRVLRGSFDQAAGLLFRDAALNQLLDATGAEATTDWIVLRDGFSGRSYHGPCFDAKPGQPAIRPMLAPFMIGTPETLARLFAKEEPAAYQFVGQCISLAASEADSDNHIDPHVVAAASGRWAKVICGLLALRESRRELVVEFSPEAARTLMAFWRRQISSHPSSSPQKRRFAQHTAVNAAKVAGSNHHWQFHWQIDALEVFLTNTRAFAVRRGRSTSQTRRKPGGTPRQARQPKVPVGSQKRTSREGRR